MSLSIQTYDPTTQDVRHDLKIQSRFHLPDVEEIVYQPLLVGDQVLQMIFRKTVGMMSDYDHRRLSDVKMKFEVKIFKQDILLFECEPSELNERIKNLGK